jgi:hypothetical protein
MADFSQSFGFELQVYEVDPVTWADKRLVGGFTSASISRTTGRMLESGSLKADVTLGKEFTEGYYRLAMRVRQGGLERYDLSTLYCMSVSGSVDHGINEVDVEGVSVLYPAQNKVMEIGSYLPRGADGAAYVRRLLADTLHAPVEAIGSFQLTDDFVFDIGAKILDCAWDVLESAKWCMQIDGRGRVTIMPVPTESAMEISEAVTMAGISYEQAISDVPNRYLAFDGMTLGQCVNDDPQSVVSTANRGFVIDFDGGVDTSPALIAGETIDAYCRRKLMELSSVTQQMTGTCEYHDGILPYSIVTVRMQPDNQMHDVMVSSQEITCDQDVSISETYVREVSLWQ